MPVFISHTTADDAISHAVFDRLTRVHNIPCYIDDLDKQANTANVTDLIVRRIKMCTNLLALVTSNTRLSWWVPFEVGVAREAPRVISSFTNLDQWDLPKYLTEWPVLRGNAAIDTFAQHYKSGSQRIKQSFLEQRSLPSEGASAVSDFHRQLKASLGQ